MKAPFPYFGGKSAIASRVWEEIGDVKHYLEPFFGSGAVLLNRPGWQPNTRWIETIVDADGLVCNTWRALQADPDAVAKVCDWPVNHYDLDAIRRVLRENIKRAADSLCADPKWYDVELAGYYIYCASCSIGSGLTRIDARPHVSHAGSGINALGKIPHLSDAGKGINKLGNTSDASGVCASVADVRDPYNTNLYVWFRRLSERLRYVRVVGGDWSRVCGGKWQTKSGVCGMFFDPPYSHDCGRDNDIYDVETDCARDVAEWAHKRGSDPRYRIVLAGYDGEHNWLESEGWRAIKWKAGGGYSKIRRTNKNANVNRFRERLWCSPFCLGGKQGELL